MKNRSQLKVGVALSYTNIIFSNIINLVYTPIMLRMLGQSEYGVYSLSASVIGYLGLFNFGFGSTYIRYFSRYKVKEDKVKIKQLNGMFLIIFSIIGILVLTSGMALIHNIDKILGEKLTFAELSTSRILMTIMVINMALSMPGSIFNSFITANEQYIFQRSIDLIKTISSPFITLPLLMLGYKSIAVVTVACVLSIVTIFINIYYCIRLMHIQFSFKGFEASLLKEIGIFSFFVFLQLLMDQINWQIDKFILGMFSGSIAVAIYSIGSQFNNYFIQFSGAIASVFTPRVHKLISQNDTNGITDLFIKVGRIQFMVVFFFYLAFLIFGQEFIYLWAGKGYENAYIVAVLLVSPIILGLTENLGLEIVKAKNIHGPINLIYFFVCIINVVISIPLCIRYGEIGSAFGTFITMTVSQVVIQNVYYYSVAKINILTYLKSLFRFFPAALPVVLIGIFIKKSILINNFKIFILTAFVYSFIYFISFWAFGMNTFEKQLIKYPLYRLYFFIAKRKK